MSGRIPEGGFFSKGPAGVATHGLILFGFSTREMPLQGMPQWLQERRVMVENNSSRPVSVQGLRQLLAGLESQTFGYAFGPMNIHLYLAYIDIRRGTEGPKNRYSIEEFLTDVKEAKIKIRFEDESSEVGILVISRGTDTNEAELRIPFAIVGGRVIFSDK